MNKLVKFGKQVAFFVRLITGIEQRRIQAFRQELDRHTEKVLAQREALRKLPEQRVLLGVRTMVEDMQKLNNLLDNTEASIKDHFKPLNAQAQAMVDMNLKEREKNMKMMGEVMKQQALLEQAEAEQTSNASSTEQNSLKEILEAMRQQASLENAEADKIANLPQESVKGTIADANQQKLDESSAKVS